MTTHYSSASVLSGGALQTTACTVPRAQHTYTTAGSSWVPLVGVRLSAPSSVEGRALLLLIGAGDEAMSTSLEACAVPRPMGSNRIAYAIRGSAPSTDLICGINVDTPAS